LKQNKAERLVNLEFIGEFEVGEKFKVAGLKIESGLVVQ
jgi:hypothetical protein